MPSQSRNLNFPPVDAGQLSNVIADVIDQKSGTDVGISGDSQKEQTWIELFRSTFASTKGFETASLTSVKPV